MRRILGVLLAVGLAACGDNDDGGGPSGPVSGTIGGQPFTPSSVSAVLIPPASCTIEMTTVNASGLVLGFGNFDLCAFLAQAGPNAFCSNKASSTLVGAVVLKIGLIQAQTAVGPGTYTVKDVGSTLPDASGNVVGVSATATRTDATCLPSFQEDATVGGTVSVSSASASAVSGSVNLAFGTGNAFAGSYDASVCAQSLDICQIVALIAGGGNCTPACIP